MDLKDLDKQSDFLFKFYTLGYDHAINMLKKGKSLHFKKEKTFKEYFMKEAVKAGLFDIKKDNP